jgi:hypothetical protein
VRADEKGKTHKHPGRAPTPTEIEAGFAEWWEAYPRKEDKGDARRAYTKCLMHKDPRERATVAQLLTAVKAYRPTERRYTKFPATWLNKGSWQTGTQPPAAPAAPPPDLDDHSGRLHAALATRVGAEVYAAWFPTLRVESVEGGRLTVSVTSKQVKNWLEQHYPDHLIGAASAVLQPVRLVYVTVRRATP